MPITVPTDGTVISASAFGAPVANQLNALVPTTWTNLTLLNGWINVAGAQPAQYRKIGDIVYIRGRIGSGTMGSLAFNMPAGFRPPLLWDISTACVVSGAWNWAFCYINPNGDFYPNNPAVNQGISISTQFSITP